MEPIRNTDEIRFSGLQELKATLRTKGCRLCDLGFQPDINGCCVSRGPLDSKMMIVGEAPGLNEDATRDPFTGPAGQLLDTIWLCAGMDTQDWYITNIVLCRPVAPRGSGKQNLTPKVDQIKHCRPFLDTQIRLLDPWIIVPMGRPATASILGLKSIRMRDYRGQIHQQGQRIIFPMIHPAAILHATGTEKYDLYRQQTWDDVRQLKKIIDERRNNV